mmetsp:Transcript_42675/g.100027  ORF Transcript_42675/g.100027 Transcript_42675/m.100027 type:complete len:236 (+) Transcript_42675:1033-1740(+)
MHSRSCEEAYSLLRRRRRLPLVQVARVHHRWCVGARRLPRHAVRHQPPARTLEEAFAPAPLCGRPPLLRAPLVQRTRPLAHLFRCESVERVDPLADGHAARPAGYDAKSALVHGSVHEQVAIQKDCEPRVLQEPAHDPASLQRAHVRGEHLLVAHRRTALTAAFPPLEQLGTSQLKCPWAAHVVREHILEPRSARVDPQCRRQRCKVSRWRVLRSPVDAWMLASRDPVGGGELGR